MSPSPAPLFLMMVLPDGEGADNRSRVPWQAIGPSNELGRRGKGEARVVGPEARVEIKNGGSIGLPHGNAGYHRNSGTSVFSTISMSHSGGARSDPGGGAAGAAALIPRLLDAGVCFGLLDPVSNIVANTICSHDEPFRELNAAATQGSWEEEEDRRSRRGTKRKAGDAEARRRRDEAMSEITKDARSISGLPPRLRLFTLRTSEQGTVSERSLGGMVTFLICYFRNLPVIEALQYLLMSKADLLATVHLIVCSRGMGGRLCPISSPAMEMALRYAAISASHPKPAIFAAKSLSLALHLEQLSQILTTGRCLVSDSINHLLKVLEEPLKQPADDSLKPVEWLAALRFNHYIKGNDSLKKFPLESTEALRILLLDKIHVFYLRVIARLPRDALCRRHHRGLLKAGHCFGPVDDPVSNIILNSIWYDTKFLSPREEFKVDMICADSIIRAGR
ncbi:hypothetical protein PR202_gb11106 [Eleusine coracana subsp. coracana]|uniref:PIR2-like helical domain-containing protein n=1 Tax=Eleusine coracana subsp. coracana TaxID=191504 RepID=A0AAV5ELS3_ELECO|nr:hypothetical protein PR202_gb11106 [Eleusine coracana subsp. coracana]